MARGRKASGPCGFEACDSPVHARGFCRIHYFRLWRHGDPAINLKPGGRVCSVEGCERPYHAHGYCQVHGSRVRRTGSPFVIRTAPGFQAIENPRYIGVHARLGRTKTGVCAKCGATGPTDMALLPGRGDRMDISGSCARLLYSIDPADYVELCRTCHWRLDRSTEEENRESHASLV